MIPLYVSKAGVWVGLSLFIFGVGGGGSTYLGTDWDVKPQGRKILCCVCVLASPMRPLSSGYLLLKLKKIPSFHAAARQAVR